MSTKTLWALVLTCALVPEAAHASNKSAAIRLKRVNQSLESVAGRARSSRYLIATGELAAGALYTFTGTGLIYGTVKYLKKPDLPETGLFPVDLGSAFIDAYEPVPGAVLGIGVGGMLTFTGVTLGLNGIREITRGAQMERYYYGEFETMPQKTEAEITRKADEGEKQLASFASQAHDSRLLYGWSNLIAGGLMLIAATAHPDEPAGFFLGGGAGVYGFVSLLEDSQPEEEYADYVAWKTDTPRDTSRGPGGFQVAALPTPRSLALGVSLGF